MSDIDICIQQLDKRYSRRVLKVQSFCKKIIRSAWFSHTPADVSLVLADDDFVHDLNFRYSGKDSATNVLSLINNRNVFIDCDELMYDIENHVKNFVETEGFVEAYNRLNKKNIIIIV